MHGHLVKFPNLSVIPEIESATISYGNLYRADVLDVTLMIDGSDSFGETVSVQDDPFKVRKF